MKKLLYLLVLVISCTYVQAQEIPEGYKYVGDIETSRMYYDGEILVSPDGKYVISSFGAKPSVVEIYEVKSWTKVNTLNTEGTVYLFIAFFNSQNPAIFYLYGRRKAVHQFNINTREYKKVKYKKLPNHVVEDIDSFWHRQPSRTRNKEGVVMRMLPGKYVTKMYSDITKIYIWEGLLDQ